jgi:hypothetical protein
LGPTVKHNRTFRGSDIGVIDLDAYNYYARITALNFTHYDLGVLSAGSVVEVSLKDSAANVRLMDSSNFSNYKNGRQHRYLGGLIKRSPVRLQVDNPGHWYVTVDMNGLRGSARSAVRVISG